MLQKISDIIWGPLTPLLFASTGLFFIIKLRFFSADNVRYILKNTFGTLFSKDKKDGISPFTAMATALGGTIGVGNTVGVASALISGGAGAVLWMIIASFFGMAIKYAEIFLAVKYKNHDNGGAVYYIEKGLGCRPLAVLFAVICIITSFGMGNMAQSDAASRYASLTFSLNPAVCGILFAIVTLCMISGGMKRIGKVSAVTVPVMAALYIVMCGIIITVNHKNIPSAVTEIFRSAFDFSAASGGVGGYFLSEAVRYGFSRGLFSNEAGMGSAPTAHAASTETVPQKQAVWGVFEVFADTVAVCGMTALAVTSGNIKAEGDPSALIYKVFTNVFGSFGGIFLTVSIVFFALASIFCWYIYGSQALKYLSESPFLLTLYRIIFSSAVYLGAVAGNRAVWNASDIFNGIMAFINIFVLVLLANEVKPPCVGQDKNKSERLKNQRETF